MTECCLDKYSLNKTAFGRTPEAVFLFAFDVRQHGSGSVIILFYFGKNVKNSSPYVKNVVDI